MGSSAQNGIGARLKAARLRCGWNREALAFYSGVSWSAIAQVEAGRRTNVRPGTLQALARALGVSIDYLVAGGPATRPMLSHRALLYATDAEFIEAAGPFLAQAVERSEPALAVTTEANIALLRERLGRAATGVEFAEREGWYTTPSAGLQAYLAFLRRGLEAGAPWVWILAEPPHLNGATADLPAWMRYEAMVNLAFGSQPVSVLCPYDTRTVGEQVLSRARATHPHLLEPHGPVSSGDYADPVRVLLDP